MDSIQKEGAGLHSDGSEYVDYDAMDDDREGAEYITSERTITIPTGDLNAFTNLSETTKNSVKPQKGYSLILYKISEKNTDETILMEKLNRNHF
jgi:hypothetical protein